MPSGSSHSPPHGEVVQVTSLVSDRAASIHAANTRAMAARCRRFDDFAASQRGSDAQPLAHIIRPGEHSGVEDRDHDFVTLGFPKYLPNLFETQPSPRLLRVAALLARSSHRRHTCRSVCLQRGKACLIISQSTSCQLSDTASEPRSPVWRSSGKASLSAIASYTAICDEFDS